MLDESAIDQTRAVPKFRFVGGDLCLDFCNTVGGKRGGVAREKLHTLSDFIYWAEQASLLKPDHAEDLRRQAVRRPAESAALLARATELREAIFRILLSASEGKTPARPDLDRLNCELAASLCRLRIGRSNTHKGFDWQWAQDQFQPDHLLGPIARSAAELLVRNDLLANVHQCKGGNCGWLFLDSSKNHSRCWCDMRDCGNRAKVRRHRKRKKS